MNWTEWANRVLTEQKQTLRREYADPSNPKIHWCFEPTRIHPFLYGGWGLDFIGPPAKNLKEKYFDDIKAPVYDLAHKSFYKAYPERGSHDDAS
jgi:hypothetical protein